MRIEESSKVDSRLAVEFINVSKYYNLSKVASVNNISLSIYENEILGIVGDNGAGKTTLMRILSGLDGEYTGSIKIFGNEIYINSVALASSLGISIVPQNDELINDFNTIENVILGRNKAGILLHSTNTANKLKELIKKYGFEIDIYKKVKELDKTKRKLVSILKALYNNSKIIILDEPTALMGEDDSLILYNTIKSLNKENTTIIIITHRVRDLINIKTRIVLMDKGEIKNTYSSVEETEYFKNDNVIKNNILENKNINNRKNKILELKNVSLKSTKLSHELQNINFSSYEGEILGITGKEANGLSELEDVLTGFRLSSSGEIFLKSENITKQRTLNLRKKGLSYVPADRIKRGSSIYSKIYENIIINKRDTFSNFGFLDKPRIKDYTNMILEQFNINTKYNNKLYTLSGGNIQRIILARELKQIKDYIIISCPSNGLDKKSTELIHQKIIDLKKANVSVILLSYDLSEILKLSDRILIIYKGSIVQEIKNSNTIKESDIYKCMAGNDNL